MANHIHARVCSPDTVGMPAPMRKMDSPAVILVITFSVRFVMTNNTVFDYPWHALKNRPRPGYLFGSQ